MDKFLAFLKWVVNHADDITKFANWLINQFRPGDDGGLAAA